MGVGRVKQDQVNENVKEIVDCLSLSPLEGEGGMFRRTYEGTLNEKGQLIYSAIYYLLTEQSFSHMHKLDTDEIYHYYMGDQLELLILYPDGTSEVKVLGTDLTKGEVPQFRVPAGCWQGSRIALGGVYSYSLVGTTMAPAYRDEEYVHGDCETLCKMYPHAADKIRERCGSTKAL